MPLSDDQLSQVKICYRAAKAAYRDNMVLLGFLCRQYAKARVADGGSLWASAKEVAFRLGEIHADTRVVGSHSSLSYVYLKLMPMSAVVQAIFPELIPGVDSFPLGQTSLSTLIEFARFAAKTDDGDFAVDPKVVPALADVLRRAAGGELRRDGVREAFVGIRRPKVLRQPQAGRKDKGKRRASGSEGSASQLVAAAQGATPRDLAGLVLRMVSAHPDPEAARKALLAELAVSKLRPPLTWD